MINRKDMIEKVGKVMQGRFDRGNGIDRWMDR